MFVCYYMCIATLERVFVWEMKKMNYKKMLIEMIEKIEDDGTLEYLHTFISLFLEKWG